MRLTSSWTGLVIVLPRPNFVGEMINLYDKIAMYIVCIASVDFGLNVYGRRSFMSRLTDITDWHRLSATPENPRASQDHELRTKKT